MRLQKLHVTTLAVVWAGVLMLTTAVSTNAQWYRDRERESYRYGFNRGERIDDVVQSLRQQTNQLDRTIGRALSQSYWAGRPEQRRLESQVRRFSNAVDRFAGDYRRSRNRNTMRDDFRVLLSQADRLNNEIRRLDLPSTINNPWWQIRDNVNRVADYYRLPRISSWVTGTGNDSRYDRDRRSDRDRDYDRDRNRNRNRR